MYSHPGDVILEGRGTDPLQPPSSLLAPPLHKVRLRVGHLLASLQLSLAPANLDFIAWAWGQAEGWTIKFLVTDSGVKTY